MSEAADMIYDDVFADALTRLHDEQRYRVFVEVERIAGPYAVWQSARPPKYRHLVFE